MSKNTEFKVSVATHVKILRRRINNIANEIKLSYSQQRKSNNNNKKYLQCFLIRFLLKGQNKKRKVND